MKSESEAQGQVSKTSGVQLCSAFLGTVALIIFPKSSIAGVSASSPSLPPIAVIFMQTADFHVQIRQATAHTHIFANTP